MKVKVKIGGVDYTKYAEIPFQTKRVIDESLDMVSIRLFYTDKKEEFEPFSLVEIEIIDDITKKIQMYVASDSVEENLATGKVNHTLVLIEETKSIERLLLTKTTTNPIAKDFTEFQEEVEPIKDLQGYTGTITIPSNYKSPSKTGEFVVAPMSEILSYGEASVHSISIEVISPFGEVIKSTQNFNESININIVLTGEYTIRYYWKNAGQLIIGNEVLFKINFVSKVDNAVEKTITYVVNSLLDTCETIRKGDKPKFSFNREQAEKYKDTPCPEMTFSKQTLWEALRQIGGVIHAIPRLKGNEVYFDSYDSIVYSDIAAKKPISKTGTFDIEQFCSTIESSVDNLIQNDNASQGAIEDFGGMFKTARTEQAEAHIRENNMYIETALPIGKIIKAEIGYLPDGTYVGDITNYIFERMEYDTLSSYDETFPTSKALALFYRLGERNIGGLVFKVEDAVSSIFRNTAIENIIRHKLSNQEPDWWNSLWRDYNEFELQFRITYQPYYSATLRQVKPNLKDLKFKSVLSYTQGANSISTQAYGENLKGAVARLGTAEKRLTYIVKHLSEVPNAGDKFDKDYVISEVNCEIHKDFILCEIGLAKKFNRWNSFVGVNNELRMYEVSEKQVSERPVIWEDYAVIQKTSENRLRESKEEIEVGEKRGKYLYGTWNGKEFILDNQYYRFYIGNNKEWQEVGDYVSTQYSLFATRETANGVQTICCSNKRFPSALLININGNEITTTETQFNLPVGYSVSATSVAYGNGKYYLANTDSYSYLANGYSRVLVGYPNDEEGTISWTEQTISTDFGRNDRKWRLVRVNDAFIAIDTNGDIIIQKDSNINEWQQLTSLTGGDIIDAKIFDGTIYAFSPSKIYKGEYDNGLTWQEFAVEFNIKDLAKFENVYVAISEDYVYYSKDLINWVRAKQTIQNAQKIIVGDKVLITNGSSEVILLDLKGSDTIFTQQGVFNIGNSLINGMSQPISIVNTKTYDTEDNLLYDYWLPVIASATGNTMQLQFEYVDNFSAGTYTNTDGNGTKTQTYAPYGNLFGEAKYLSVEFFDELPFNYSDTDRLEQENQFEKYRKAGDNLPIIDLPRNENVKSVLNSSCDLYRGNKNHILLNKDNREKIKFTYCLHYVANDDDIVVGSGLAQMNAFVLRYSGEKTNENPLARVYILDREIGEFEKSVDLTGAIEQESSIRCYVDTEFGKLRFRAKKNETMLADGKSWVVVIKNPYNKEEDLLLFGKNVEFKQGDLASDVWADYEIAFTHHVDEYL